MQATMCLVISVVVIDVLVVLFQTAMDVVAVVVAAGVG